MPVPTVPNTIDKNLFKNKRGVLIRTIMLRKGAVISHIFDVFLTFLAPFFHIDHPYSTTCKKNPPPPENGDF